MEIVATIINKSTNAQLSTTSKADDILQIEMKDVLKKYQGKVYNHIRAMVIDHDDANDVMQDVFIKVWRNLDKFRGKSQMYTWIYRIATNESINFLNRKKRRFFLPIGNIEAEMQNLVAQNIMPDSSEIERKLQMALVKLPEKQRAVFNLKYYQEMKYEEMAQVFNTSIGALKASYHLAVKKN